MLILLPPSQTKRPRRRGVATDLDSVSFAELNPTRRQVAESLSILSAQPDATTRLGVSPGLSEEVAHNTRLTTAPAVPVAQLYTGVLYDALDVASLDSSSRRRAGRQVVIVSAAYGALRLKDKVAPYCASMDLNLPGLGPLAKVWRGPLTQALSGAAGRGVIVDCRSSTYVAPWRPGPDQAGRWVQIRVPGATHMAKHTRGLVTRALAELATAPRDAQELQEALSGPFRVELHSPERSSGPWVLDALPA